jgi:hypothetical protein
MTDTEATEGRCVVQGASTEISIPHPHPHLHLLLHHCPQALLGRLSQSKALVDIKVIPVTTARQQEGGTM